MRFVVLLSFGALGLSAVAAPLLRPVAVLEVPHARALAFSPDGSFLAVAAGEEVVLFSPGNWTQAGALRGHTGTVSDLVFLRSGGLATASWDGTVRLWDPKSGTVIGTIPVSRGASDILAVAVSPDEKVVVVGCVEEKTGLGMVMWYEVASGRLLRSRILSVAQKMGGGRDTQIYRVRAVRFDPQGTLLAAGSEDRLLRMWDRIGDTEIVPPKEHAGTVYALAFSPDGQRLAAATWGEVVIWNVGTGAKAAVLSGHRSEVWAVAYSPDGALLASGAYDGYVRLWDGASFSLLLRSERVVTPISGFGAPVVQGILSLAFSPDGRFLAAAASSGRVHVWEVGPR